MDERPSASVAAESTSRGGNSPRASSRRGLTGLSFIECTKYIDGQMFMNGIQWLCSNLPNLMLGPLRNSDDNSRFLSVECVGVVLLARWLEMI